MVLSRNACIVLLFSIVALSMLYVGKDSNMTTIPGSGRKWQKIADTKRRENIAKIPQEWLLSERIIVAGQERKEIAGDFIESLLDQGTLEITSQDSEDILDLLRNGSLSALQVTTAFCKRAAYAHQLVCNSPFHSFPCTMTKAL